MVRGLSRAERSFFAMAREQRAQRKSIRVDTAKPASSSRDFSERVRSVRSRQLARARATMARYGVKASSGHSGG